MTRYVLGMLAVAGLGLVGCSDDDGHTHEDAATTVRCVDETRTDPYVAGMEVVGTNGYKVKLMSSTPAPPAKGDNLWELQLLDSSDTPIDGATLDLTPFMPDHGHGTPIGATVTPMNSDGMYMADPVNLWMPAYWEVTVDIDDGGVTDSVVFKTCIDG